MLKLVTVWLLLAQQPIDKLAVLRLDQGHPKQPLHFSVHDLVAAGGIEALSG